MLMTAKNKYFTHAFSIHWCFQNQWVISNDFTIKKQNKY